MGDAGDRPTLCPAVGNAEQMFEGKLVGVAHYEVVLYVEGGQSAAERGIDWVHFFAHVRRLIDGFAEGVAGEQLQALAGVAEAEFQRVVVGIADRGLIGIAAEIRAQRSAGSTLRFFKRSAARQAEAQRGVAGVRFHQHQQAMRLIAHIAGAEHSIAPRAGARWRTCIARCKECGC